MLTRYYVPKLANFKYACTTKGKTSLINDLMTNEIVRWLAPEKIVNKSARYSRYNAKCEIFRYIF